MFEKLKYFSLENICFDLSSRIYKIADPLPSGWSQKVDTPTEVKNASLRKKKFSEVYSNTSMRSV